MGHSRCKGPLPWNLTGAGPPSIPSPASGVACSPSPASPSRSVALVPLQTQLSATDSPGSPAAFHGLLPSLTGTRHVPAAAFIPRPGGAERSRVEPAARWAGAQRWAPPRSLRAGERRARCGAKSGGGGAGCAETTGHTRRAAGVLAGSVARGGGSRARCASTLRAWSGRAGRAGRRCTGPSALSGRGVWKRRSLKGWDAEEDHLAVRQRVDLHWTEAHPPHLYMGKQAA